MNITKGPKKAYTMLLVCSCNERRVKRQKKSQSMGDSPVVMYDIIVHDRNTYMICMHASRRESNPRRSKPREAKREKKEIRQDRQPPSNTRAGYRQVWDIKRDSKTNKAPEPAYMRDIVIIEHREYEHERKYSTIWQKGSLLAIFPILLLPLE